MRLNNLFVLFLVATGLSSAASAADCEAFLRKIDHRVFANCTVSVDATAYADLNEFSIASSSGMTYSNGNITEHANYYHFVLSSKTGGASRGFSGFTSGFDERAQNFLGSPSHNTCADEHSLFYVISRGGQIASKGTITLSNDGSGIQAEIVRAGKPELAVSCTSSEAIQ